MWHKINSNKWFLFGFTGFFSMIDNFGWASLTNTWVKTGKSLASFYEHNTPWPTTFMASFGSNGKLLRDTSKDFLWVSCGNTAISTDESDDDGDMGLPTQPIPRSDMLPSTYTVRAEPVSDRDDDDEFENDSFLMDIVQPKPNIVTFPSEHGIGMSAEAAHNSIPSIQMKIHGHSLHSSTPVVVNPDRTYSDTVKNIHQAPGVPQQNASCRPLFPQKNPPSISTIKDKSGERRQNIPTRDSLRDHVMRYGMTIRLLDGSH